MKLPIIRENDKRGKVSTGRVISLVLILFYLVTATATFVVSKRLPDIPTNLAMLIASLYGINKVSSMFGERQ